MSCWILRPWAARGHTERELYYRVSHSAQWKLERAVWHKWSQRWTVLWPGQDVLSSLIQCCFCSQIVKKESKWFYLSPFVASSSAGLGPGLEMSVSAFTPQQQPRGFTKTNFWSCLTMCWVTMWGFVFVLFFHYLQQGGYVLVCVCLFVGRITQKQLTHRSGVGREITHQFLLCIGIRELLTFKFLECFPTFSLIS